MVQPVFLAVFRSVRVRSREPPRRRRSDARLLPLSRISRRDVLPLPVARRRRRKAEIGGAARSPHPHALKARNCTDISGQADWPDRALLACRHETKTPASGGLGFRAIGQSPSRRLSPGSHSCGVASCRNNAVATRKFPSRRYSPPRTRSSRWIISVRRSKPRISSTSAEDRPLILSASSAS